MRELSSELVKNYEAECLEQGFKYLGRGSSKGYSLVKCNVCGDVDSYDSGAMRKGEVRCKACKITQYSNECLAQGFRFIRKIDKRNSLTECLECGDVDSYNQNNIRKGKVRCEQCLVNKYKSLVKTGWEYIDKSRIKNQTYVTLKHDCSNNLVNVNSSDFLKCSYDCPHCSQTHFDDHSYFYVIKVTHNNNSMIKIGVSNDTGRRFSQYGLPDDTILEIVHIEPFTTKRLAIMFESMAKQALKNYKEDNEIAKTIFTIQGHTECFTENSLEEITRLLSESSGEPSGE